MKIEYQYECLSKNGVDKVYLVDEKYTVSVGSDVRVIAVNGESTKEEENEICEAVREYFNLGR